MLGKEEAGLDGTNLLAGIEAMNGPGHTSIPVRRTQSYDPRVRQTRYAALSSAPSGTMPDWR